MATYNTNIELKFANLLNQPVINIPVTAEVELASIENLYNAYVQRKAYATAGYVPTPFASYDFEDDSEYYSFIREIQFWVYYQSLRVYTDAYWVHDVDYDGVRQVEYVGGASASPLVFYEYVGGNVGGGTQKGFRRVTSSGTTTVGFIVSSDIRGGWQIADLLACMSKLTAFTPKTLDSSGYDLIRTRQESKYLLYSEYGSEEECITDAYAQATTAWNSNTGVVGQTEPAGGWVMETAQDTEDATIFGASVTTNERKVQVSLPSNLSGTIDYYYSKEDITVAEPATSISAPLWTPPSMYSLYKWDTQAFSSADIAVISEWTPIVAPLPFNLPPEQGVEEHTGFATIAVPIVKPDFTEY